MRRWPFIEEQRYVLACPLVKLDPLDWITKALLTTGAHGREPLFLTRADCRHNERDEIRFFFLFIFPLAAGVPIQRIEILNGPTHQDVIR